MPLGNILGDCVENGNIHTKTSSSRQQKVVKIFKWPKSGDSSDDAVPDKLKFVFISDTHTYLTDPNCIPNGDVLLHAGDFTMNGTFREIRMFNEFLGKLPHRWKFVIAGNHDIYLENREKTDPKLARRMTRTLMENFGVSQCRDLLTNCVYLEDELVNVCDITIYGSPWTLQCRGAFQLPKGGFMKKKWDEIPDDVDILMTHGPPYGICDTTRRGVHAGCSDLLAAVQNRVKPKLHLFGHIHEGYGEYSDGTTRFINASICTVDYNTTNKPFVFSMRTPNLKNKTADIISTSNCYTDSGAGSLHEESVGHQHRLTGAESLSKEPQVLSNLNKDKGDR